MIKVKVKQNKGMGDLFDREIREHQDVGEDTLLAYKNRFEKSLWPRYVKSVIDRESGDLNLTPDAFIQYLADSNLSLLDMLSPAGYLDWFLGEVKNWEYSVVRQYRAASRYSLKEKFAGHADLSPSIQLLERLDARHSKTGIRKVAKKSGASKAELDMLGKETSGNKAKRVTEKHLDALLGWLEDNIEKDPDLLEGQKKVRGKWLFRSVKMLLATIMTGLRPVEWASIEEIKESDGLITLKVTNAKNTNGRAHGEFRYVGIQKDHPLSLIVEAHIELVRSFIKDGGTIQDYRDECNGAIKKVEAAIEKETGLKKTGYCMYSGRHQFSANAKKQGVTDNQLAYMMGHNSLGTANSHYGKASVGYKSRKIGGRFPSIEPLGEVIKETSPKPESVNFFRNKLLEAKMLAKGESAQIKESQPEPSLIPNSQGGGPSI